MSDAAREILVLTKSDEEPNGMKLSPKQRRNRKAVEL